MPNEQKNRPPHIGNPQVC